MRNGTRDAFAPLQRGLSALFRPVGDFFAGAVNYGNVVQENEQLRNQVGQLRRQALENAGAEQQLNELLSVEHLPFLQNSKAVVAEVVSNSSSNFALTIEIDRGTAEGVGPGMPVVSGAGLIGTVTSAGTSTSLVRLITDPSSQIGVRFPNGTIAVASGQGRGEALSLSDITSSAPAPRKGQQVVTSGLLGAAFPAGIPVGSVSAVKTTGGALTRQVEMKPVANLSNLQYVDVIQWLPSA